MKASESEDGKLRTEGSYYYKKGRFFASRPHRQLLAIDTIFEHIQRLSIRYKNFMSINTTAPATMSSSDSALDLYTSVIGHTFSSFGNIFASLGLWIVHGLTLALCFFVLIVAVFVLLSPIKLIAERIFETISATAPSNEHLNSQHQQQDLEANMGSLEGVRVPEVERAPDNTTKEQDHHTVNESSHATDTEMVSQAANDSTDEQVPLDNISDPGPSNADDGECLYPSDGEIVDDRGSDYASEEPPVWPVSDRRGTEDGW